MTLSRWLRDYLYIPLGGNKKGRVRTYVNLLATMLLGGLWHGAAWTFVIWGGLHGTGLAVERFARDLSSKGRRVVQGGPWSRWFGRIVTFHFVCFAWIFFRAPSLHAAGSVIGRLFSAWGQPSPLVTTGVVLAIAAGLAANFLPGRVVAVTFARFARLPVAAQAACLAVGLMLVDTLGPQGVAPFIYFRF
jgi:D-alanyl-lipoteichoic acid acyltransferase DltB (MBOAT superfamily)